MTSKIRFGLRNTKYAIWDSANNTYGQFKDLKGAVSLSLSREGGDNTDFYADDGVYFTFAGTNGGYSADLEVARITDEIRVDLLGEIIDEGTGIQFEEVHAMPAEFALVTEMQGDSGPIGFVFYNCKASRPEMNANTQGENPDVDTDTLNIRMASRSFTYLGEEKDFVQGHIEKTSDNTAQYTAFFTSVVVPTSSNLSA